MEWFKHDSSASSDAKVKKLLLRYGTEGYAIYFHCLELICGDVNKNNITFELEHDSEIIADNLKIKGTAEKGGIEIVEEIMRYIVDLGLFINHKDKILLDFGKQYRVFMDSYYVLTLEWEGFEGRESGILLKTAMLRSRRLDFSPTLRDTDYIVVNTETHDTNNFKITKEEGFIPLNYKAYLLKEDGNLYNFDK